MTLITTKTVTVAATATALPAHGGAALAWSLLIHNTGANALTVAAAADADGFSVPAGATMRLPCNRPDNIFVKSASGTTADVAYFA